jgi:hypothetical protein
MLCNICIFPSHPRMGVCYVDILKLRQQNAFIACLFMNLSKSLCNLDDALPENVCLFPLSVESIYFLGYVGMSFLNL